MPTRKTLKLATFNINGIAARLPNLLEWLQEAKPDVVALQELKANDAAFPADALEQAGYGAIWHGQKSWNGVALLGRGVVPVESRRGLPGDAQDPQSRYLEAAIHGVIVGGLYLPNGNPQPGPKFDYKLRWMARLRALTAERLDRFTPLAILGDFNVCPTEADLAPRALPPTDALVRPESRAAFRALVNLGLTDAVRALHPAETIYTYWDYGPAFEQNRGLRIDHALLSADLAERLTGTSVDVAARAAESPSDHAPVLFDLAD